MIFTSEPLVHMITRTLYASIPHQQIDRVTECHALQNAHVGAIKNGTLHTSSQKLVFFLHGYHVQMM